MILQQLKTSNPNLYAKVAASPEAAALCEEKPGFALLAFNLERVGKFGDGTLFNTIINSAAFQAFLQAFLAAILAA